MKLAAKLIFFLVVGMVLIVAIEAYVSIHRDMKAFEDELTHDAKQTGRTLAVLVEDVWRRGGRNRALQLIKEADEAEDLVDIRWVWLDAQPGEPYAPLVPAEQLKDIKEGTQTPFPERDAYGRPILCFYEPVDLDLPHRGALELSLAASAFDKFRHDTIVGASVVAVSVIATSAVLAVVLGLWLIGRPLHQLTEKTRRIGAGDLSGPLRLNSRDEFAELAGAINEMCELLASSRDRLQRETEARISTMEQLQHADRLATVGRLAAGMAHELGTPMNVVSARAASIVEEGSSEEAAANATVIRGQIDRMTTIIRQLLAFARRQSPRKAQVDLSRLVADTVDLLSALAGKKNVEFQITSPSDPLIVQADDGQLQQVLINLLTNAVDAMPKGGRVELEIREVVVKLPGTGADPSNGYARIDVRDQGSGISDEDLRRIFDPFFTTKEIGAGTGLGLSIAFGIVLEHGGWIDVSSRVGGGSCFSVFLPLPSAADVAAVGSLPVNPIENVNA